MGVCVMRINDKEKMVVKNRMGEAFVIVDKAIVANSIDLDAYDKSIYMALKSFANGSLEMGEQVAFPSMQLLGKIAGCLKQRTLRSIKKLEFLGLISVERKKKEDGSNEANIYHLEPIPEFIKLNAVKCYQLDEKELKALRTEKESEFRVYLGEGEKGSKKQTETAKNETKEDKQYSDKQKLLLKEISMNLGKGYKLNENEVKVIEENRLIEEIVKINNNEVVVVEGKNNQSYLKVLFKYIKVFKSIPNEEERKWLVEMLKEFAPKPIADTLSKFKDKKNELITEEFKKEVKEKDFQQAKRFIPNIEKEEKKDIFKGQNISDYENEEDKWLFED